jgi:hypothetical protein
VIRFASASGAVLYWLFITSFGVLLVGGVLLEIRRRRGPIRRWHAIAGALAVLGFAALGFSGVGRSFYALERTAEGLRLTYHWPTRRVLVPWDSIVAVNTAPGYKGQRPLRVVGRDGGRHVSAMIPVHEALRLSRCLTGEVARHQGGGAPAVGSADECH